MRSRGLLHKGSGRSRVDTGDDAVPEFVKAWVVRILFDLRAYHEYAEDFHNASRTLAAVLGLEKHYDNHELETKDIKRLLRKARNRCSRAFSAEIDNPVLAANIGSIADKIGLSEPESLLLTFALVLHSDALLAEVAEFLGQVSVAQCYRSLAVILDLSADDVRQAFAPSSVLSRTALVSMDRGRASFDLADRLELMDSELGRILEYEIRDPVDILKNRLLVSPPPVLALSDYPHIKAHLDILLPYLKTAVASGRRGINVLLYGPPGTGKTQLVRAVAGELRCRLYDVCSEDEDGDAISPRRRLGAFHTAQGFISSDKNLLVFDECEDVFSDAGFLGVRGDMPGKASINRVLEEAVVPSFWIANDIDCMDPAYVRRFDMVIELPVPPLQQRMKIISRECRGLASDNLLKKLAAIDTLSPAVVARSGSVVRCIQSGLSSAQRSDSLSRLVESTLHAQGHRVSLKRSAGELPDYYDPGFANTGLDLTALVDGLRSAQCGRLCLYGPPGTGKTAFGRWLARELGLPLVLKRASDLLSPYIGETEQQIALAFRQAERDNALLLIDEVDSFLQDRRGANRSWEVTQVNEFLTQMENYEGVFIASTNLMSGLDQAAMRRFDIKAKFDYLRPEQAWGLFVSLCRQLKLSTRRKGLRERLDALRQLTPGDYAVIARSHRFRPFADAGEVISALSRECDYKEPNQSVIGFV